VEFTAPGVLYAFGLWVHWVTHPRLVLAVSDGTCGSYRSPSPAHFRKSVHPLGASRPFRVLPSLSPPELGFAPAPSLGLPPLFATSTGGIVTAGFPCPTAFRPRRFSRPRRFDPPPALRVCFTPQPRPGFTVQGVSLAHSRATSSVSRALSPLARRHCQRFPTSAVTPRPILRAFIRARIRCYERWGLATARARSPLRFFLLQVFALPTVRTPSRPCRS